MTNALRMSGSGVHSKGDCFSVIHCSRLFSSFVVCSFLFSSFFHFLSLSVCVCVARLLQVEVIAMFIGKSLKWSCLSSRKRNRQKSNKKNPDLIKLWSKSTDLLIIGFSCRITWRRCWYYKSYQWTLNNRHTLLCTDEAICLHKMFARITAIANFIQHSRRKFHRHAFYAYSSRNMQKTNFLTHMSHIDIFNDNIHNIDANDVCSPKPNIQICFANSKYLRVIDKVLMWVCRRYDIKIFNIR